MTGFGDGEEPPVPRDDAPWDEPPPAEDGSAGEPPPPEGVHWPERDLATGGQSDAPIYPPDEGEGDAAIEPHDEGEADEPGEQPDEGDPDTPDDTPQDEPAHTDPDEPPLPVTEAGTPTTTFSGDPGDDGWDPRRDQDRRRPTTAEQAVPWLIGLILALTGMVIVLLALIFVGPDGTGLGESPTPTVEPSMSVSTAPTSSPSQAATQVPTPTATPAPSYGPLEMTYLARSTANAPTSVYRRDFSTTTDPVTLAQASGGVSAHAWAPDGRNGVALIGGRVTTITPGEDARTLAEGVNAIAFGNDSATVWAMTITRNGANDDAALLAIDFASGDTRTVGTVSFRHIETFPDPPLRESQFVDNGGLVRVYPTIDGRVITWILAAPAIYRFDPTSGEVTEVVREPILWSPDESYTIGLVEKTGTVTTIEMRDKAGTVIASVDVAGLVSHVRWAGGSNEIVFTLGRSSSGGGVRQDLYVWDLVDDKAPSALTSNGASFGAEWLGVRQSWLP